MVERVKKLLHKEFSSTSEAALLLGSFSLLSQIFGLVRDKMLAYTMGPSFALDAYYAAFRIPDFLFATIASLTSVTIILPFLVNLGDDSKPKEKFKSARDFVGDIFTVFLFIMLFFIAIAFFALPYIAKYLVPGFGPEQTKDFIDISRIMLLSPFFLGLSNLFGSITQLLKKFFSFAFAPVLYNLGIIVGIFFVPSFGIKALAFGVVLGAVLHMLIQIPVVVRYSGLPFLKKNINWSSVKKVFATSLPRTIALSMNSIALIVIVSFASKIGEGAISVFNFAMHLQGVPLGIIGVSYAVATFPVLAKGYSGNDIPLFARTILSSARQIIFWSLPILVLFIVLRAQIVRVILGSGQFDWSDTRLTAASLALFSVSITAQSLLVLFVRGFYAAGNTKIPLIVNSASSFFIILFSPLAISFFENTPWFSDFIESTLRVYGLSGTSILMLPLVYSIGTIINAYLLWKIFKVRFINGFGFSLKQTLIRSFGASILGGVVAYGALSLFSHILNTDTFIGILLQGLIAGIVGIFVISSMLKAWGSEEMDIVYKALKNKFWTKKIKEHSPEDQSIA